MSHTAADGGKIHVAIKGQWLNDSGQARQPLAPPADARRRRKTAVHAPLLPRKAATSHTQPCRLPEAMPSNTRTDVAAIRQTRAVAEQPNHRSPPPAANERETRCKRPANHSAPDDLNVIFSIDVFPQSAHFAGIARHLPEAQLLTSTPNPLTALAPHRRTLR